MTGCISDSTLIWFGGWAAGIVAYGVFFLLVGMICSLACKAKYTKEQYFSYFLNWAFFGFMTAGFLLSLLIVILVGQLTCTDSVGRAIGYGCLTSSQSLSISYWMYSCFYHCYYKKRCSEPTGGKEPEKADTPEKANW